MKADPFAFLRCARLPLRRPRTLSFWRVPAFWHTASAKNDVRRERFHWVQFESPHSVDEIRAARAAVTGPFSFMKGKLGHYLDLDEHLALGVTIAWYPGFTHHVTWAALWDFMTAFQSGGVKAADQREPISVQAAWSWPKQTV